MKRILLGFGLVLLLAAGCNKTAQNTKNNSNTGAQNQNTQQTNQANTEFKFVTPKGGEKWKSGTTQTIAWTGGGKYYATSLTLHYTINAGPYTGQPGEQGIGTPTNQSGKNYDTFQWFIAEDIWQTKGPYTISACLVDQMPGNAYSGCRSEKITSPAFEIEANQPAQNNNSSNLVYTNDRLGFQLTLTEVWQGYQAVNGQDGVSIEVPKYKIDGNNFAPLNIFVLPKEEYDRYVAQNDPALTSGQLKFIAEKNGQAYLYTDNATPNMSNEKYPKDSSGKPVNFDVAKVISTFKFTK